MARAPLSFSKKLLEHRPARQFVQQFLCGVRTRSIRTKSFTRGTQPLQPYFIFGTEFRLEFHAKPLRERRALAVRGDGNLQVAALDYGSIVKMAMLGVIDGVAQDSARIRLAKNGFV